MSAASSSTPSARERGSVAYLAANTTKLREFLAFKLGTEEYGIDILSVQEIRSFEKPTRMANSPAFVLGVVNLRGVIVPVLDMRLKFNLTQVDYSELTVCIVLSIQGRTVGMVVDGVSDVVALDAAQMRPVPEFTSSIGSENLLAIGSLGDRMLILLDIDKLMSSPEMGLISSSIQ